MTEQRIIERLLRATQGLAYWSRELLSVNTAIERHVASGSTNIKRRSTARKDTNDATTGR